MYKISWESNEVDLFFIFQVGNPNWKSTDQY